MASSDLKSRMAALSAARERAAKLMAVSSHAVESSAPLPVAETRAKPERLAQQSHRSTLPAPTPGATQPIADGAAESDGYDASQGPRKKKRKKKRRKRK